MRPESRLWNVVLLHGYLMITGGKVNCGEVFGLPQPIQQVVYPRERVAILDGLFSTPGSQCTCATDRPSLGQRESVRRTDSATGGYVPGPTDLQSGPGAPRAPSGSTDMVVGWAVQRLARF